MDNEYKHYQMVFDYVERVISGKRLAGKEVVLACERFRKWTMRDDIFLNPKKAEFVIEVIEKTIVHKQGQAIDGTPLVGKPFILQDWQVFIIYNLIGWHYKGTEERVFKEAFIMIPRKNGKSSLIAALAWGVALLERKSGSTIYVVAAAMKQAIQSFDFILNSLRFNGMIEQCRVRDNTGEHSIEYEFQDEYGRPAGSIHIEALASNPDKQDSYNCLMAIADEVHAFKSAAQYNRFKEAGAAYTNRLMVGITTAGDNTVSFCYQRLEYSVKVVNGTVQDDSMFVFVSRADQDESGFVDYTNPIQHEKANPSYGITIRPDAMIQSAMQAMNDPQQRKDFLSRNLNIYTAAMNAYFNMDEVRRSDKKYNWTLEQLSKLPIYWYGGADLSKLHDLTAACLYGSYNGVDIVIPHCWFPITAAAAKADEDNIPLFGWKDDGWLSLCNSPTVNHAEVVNWFVAMRAMGFKIRQVNHDRKFCREYFIGMKNAKFRIVDQPQYFYKKSEGFRHIEKKIKNEEFYYMHSKAFEYCISNVRGIEKTDDMIEYEKVQPTQRIDIFDAAVFAALAHIDCLEKAKEIDTWFSGNAKQ